MKANHYLHKAIFHLLILGFYSINCLGLNIDSIRLTFDNHQLVLPGEKIEFGIIAYCGVANQRSTGEKGKDGISWRHFNITVQGGQFRSGKIWVDKFISQSESKYVKVVVSPKNRPELESQLIIPLNHATSLRFVPLHTFDKAPGSSFRGRVLVTYDNGTIRQYAKLHTTRESEKFAFSAYGGTWINGRFFIDPDFQSINDHRVTLIVNLRDDPTVSCHYDVLLDYRHHYQLNYNAGSGSNGFSGANGSPGAPGCAGTDGQFGDDGQPGYNAPDIELWADLYFDSLLQIDLIYVHTRNLVNNDDKFYLINPDGGSIILNAAGGDGGSGGNGGKGGDGGRGLDGKIWYEQHTEKKVVQRPQTRNIIKKEKRTETDAAGKTIETEVEIPSTETYMEEVVETVTITEEHQGPGQDGGNGGFGGGGGFGGPGGNGGDIYCYFTEDVYPYINKIVVINRGGSGGFHGSAGSGGMGGSGGTGNPDGQSGFSGGSGPSSVGFSAADGFNGRTFTEIVQDFYGYNLAPNPQ